MKGFLHIENDVKGVRWSDLHSYSEGTLWSFTPLHPDYESLFDVEGKQVEVEFVTDGYDVINYTPYNYAKIVEPVEKFKVRVRFPNDDYPIELTITKKDFIVSKIFDKEVFGDYKGTHIAIKREDYEKIIL